MGIGAIAAFTQQGSGLTGQVIFISAAFMIFLFPSVGVWMFFGSALQRLLRSSLHQRIFNVSMALLLSGSIITMIK